MKLESLKDAFNLRLCCEILQLSQTINNVSRSKKLKKISSKKIKALYRPYINIIKTINKRIKELQYHKKDIETTSVWYKWGGEHCAIAQDFKTSRFMLLRAISLFKDVTETKCDKLTQECHDVLNMLQ